MNYKENKNECQMSIDDFLKEKSSREFSKINVTILS